MSLFIVNWSLEVVLLRVELLDDEVLDLGMCILKASPKKALESLDESHESEVDSEFDYETLD